MLEFAIPLDGYNLMIYRAGTAEGGGGGGAGRSMAQLRF